MIAVSTSNVDVIKSFLRSGIDTNKPNPILPYAVAIGDRKIIRILMHYGADPNLSNKNGKNSFQIINNYSQSDIIDILKAEGDTGYSNQNLDGLEKATTVNEILDLIPPFNTM